jgi:hypothetical protein
MVGDCQKTVGDCQKAVSRGREYFFLFEDETRLLEIMNLISI